jgi:hypothetical protein
MTTCSDIPVRRFSPFAGVWETMATLWARAQTNLNDARAWQGTRYKARLPSTSDQN